MRGENQGNGLVLEGRTESLLIKRGFMGDLDVASSGPK